jgi:hypothetical protein
LTSFRTTTRTTSQRLWRRRVLRTFAEWPGEDHQQGRRASPSCGPEQAWIRSTNVSPETGSPPWVVRVRACRRLHIPSSPPHSRL